jgi:hypothetical protein
MFRVKPAIGALLALALGFASCYVAAAFPVWPPLMFFWPVLPASAILLGRRMHFQLTDAADRPLSRWAGVARSGSSIGWFSILMAAISFLALPSLLTTRVSMNHQHAVEDIRRVLAARRLPEDLAALQPVRGYRRQFWSTGDRFAYVAIPLVGDHEGTFSRQTTGHQPLCGDASGWICRAQPGESITVVDARCPHPLQGPRTPDEVLVCLSAKPSR